MKYTVRLICKSELISHRYIEVLRPDTKTGRYILIGDLDLTAKDENNLRIDRQILRKIFDPVNIDSIWRIRNNIEIGKLIEGADIMSKVQRVK
jgi:hypothetical protein